jgi:hypothetical protein
MFFAVMFVTRAMLNSSHCMPYTGIHSHVVGVHRALAYGELIHGCIHCHGDSTHEGEYIYHVSIYIDLHYPFQLFPWKLVVLIQPIASAGGGSRGSTS